MIIFLHGPETFRSRRLLRELKDKFIKDIDPESGSLSVLEGAGSTLKEIAEKINTGSLFVKKRLIVIENIFKNKKEKIFSELLNYLPDFSQDENNIIIFWDEDLGLQGKSLKTDAKKLFSFLVQQKFTQEFPILSPAQLLSFVSQEVKSHGKEINSSAASKLISLTNGDLWVLSQEIKKLAFHESEKNISEASVKEMVSGAFNEDIFALTDALSAKNKSLTLKLLEEQYAAGLSDEYLIVMLIRQFKILLQIREALDKKISPNDLASKLKLHPYVAKKGASQARNFSSENLKNYLNNLIHLDFSNKTGGGQIKTELMMLIASL